jgi:hypothetical protein
MHFAPPSSLRFESVGTGRPSTASFGSSNRRVRYDFTVRAGAGAAPAPGAGAGAAGR